MYYRGRDMVLAHRGMRINESDWNVFLGHAAATLAKFKVPEAEQSEVVKFVQGLKQDIVVARTQVSASVAAGTSQRADPYELADSTSNAYHD